MNLTRKHVGEWECWWVGVTIVRWQVFVRRGETVGRYESRWGVWSRVWVGAGQRDMVAEWEGRWGREWDGRWVRGWVGGCESNREGEWVGWGEKLNGWAQERVRYSGWVRKLVFWAKRITSGLKQTSIRLLFTLHTSHETTNSLKNTKSVLTQIYI